MCKFIVSPVVVFLFLFLWQYDQDVFTSLIAVNFPTNISKQDLRALFKRSNIVLFGRKFVYYRGAGAGKKDIKVHIYPGGMAELLTAASKKRMGAYKEGLSVQAPPEHTAWSERLVAAAINKESITGFQVRIESILENGETSVQEIHVKPTLHDLGSNALTMDQGAMPSTGASSSIAIASHPAIACKREVQDDKVLVWNKKLKASPSVMIDVEVELEEDDDNTHSPVIKKESLVDAKHKSTGMIPSTSASASTTPWDRVMTTSANVIIDLDDGEDVGVVGYGVHPEASASQHEDEHMNMDELLQDLLAVGDVGSVDDEVAAVGVGVPMESD